MNIDFSHWVAFVRDRRGVTALEYAIIAGVLGTALVTAFGIFAPKLGAAINGIVF